MALLPLEAEIESLVLYDLLAGIDDRPNDRFVRLPLARHPGGDPLVVVNDRDCAVGRCLPQREVQAAQLSEDMPALLEGNFNLLFGTQRARSAASPTGPVNLRLEGLRLLSRVGGRKAAGFARPALDAVPSPDGRAAQFAERLREAGAACEHVHSLRREA
jgi:hypothetical protein